MKKVEEVPIHVKTIIEKLKEVTCNKCGKKLYPKNNDKYLTFFDYVEANFIEFDIQFSYGSKKEGEQWKFDLCNKCTDDLLDWFLIKPDIIQNIDTI